MKTIKLFFLTMLTIILYPIITHAQYVVQTLQQRIDSDNASIALDKADIAIKQADIDSIINDESANSVTSQVKDKKDKVNQINSEEFI